MNKVYESIGWKNGEEGGTPLDSNNLNRMDNALNEIDNRVLSLNYEIEDARTGADNKIYNTFGEASRSQFSIINKKLEFDFESGFDGWEMSSLSVNSGKPLDNPVNNRIRSMPISIDNDMQILSRSLMFGVYVYHWDYGQSSDPVFDGIWNGEEKKLVKGAIFWCQYADTKEIKSSLPDDKRLRYIKIVAREIDDKEAIDTSYGSQIYFHFSDSLTGWQSGTFNYEGGAILNWNLRINTKSFIDSYVTAVDTEELDLSCYVYDKHRKYLGYWQNSTQSLSTKKSVEFSKSFNLSKIREFLFSDYPDCIFKIVAKYPDESEILPSAGSFVNFRYGKKTEAGKSINILFVGNSFTQDENAYMPPLLKEAIPDLTFKIGILFHGSGSLQDQYNHMVDKTPYTTFSVYTSNRDSWLNQSDVLLETALAIYDWDIVVFQQAQSTGTTYESCQPYLNALIDGYTELLGHNVKFMWQLPHSRNAYDGKTHKELFELLSEQAQEVLDKTAICGVFPSGTAIENARTTALDSLGVKSHLVYDTTAHLQEGIPCLVAAYANVLKICELIGENRIGVMGSQIMPNDSWVTAQNIPNPHGGSVGTTEENRLLAAKCAIMAYKKPFVVTDCSSFDFT